MNLGDQHRVAKRHLDRSAVVYARISDPRQVRENVESTMLQRGLRERAVELGWPMPKLVEDDPGITASGFAERPGFQWMMAQVTLRRIGIIFCIDASRLSRNSSDWAHLFELCGHFDTLVADIQQVYDVSIPNDRLVLQIKGTVAELELTSLRTRLRAGVEAKAARGELKMSLPPGYVYDADDQILIDPDERVQQAIRAMFERFEHATSVRQLALSYRDTNTLFPIRRPRKLTDLVWGLPQRYVLHKLLSHPIYAGVYSRGRTQTFVDCVDGQLIKRTRRVTSPEQWKVCIRDHHEAYISWQQFGTNQAKLAEARPRWLMDDNRTAVREGRALPAGMLRCGQCGRKLRVIYNRKSSAMYYCDGGGPRGTQRCLAFGAKYVDREVGEQLCQAMEPVAVEAAERAFALDPRQREQGVEQARLRAQAAQYAADRAFEQYDLADPKNRLVVDNLEKRLNEKLAEVRRAQAELERRIEDDPPLTDQQRKEGLDDGEIARILNMKKLRTPRDLTWTKDRVQAFRSRHGIKLIKMPHDPDVLTGQQARDYLGIGYNGLLALVRRGAIHTNQVTDFAPWRIPRAELDSEPVQAMLEVLKVDGRLPPQGGAPENQRQLFPERSTFTRKGVL